MGVLERFLKYIQVDTPSCDANSMEVPSNKAEFNLAYALQQELKEMGIFAEVSENCYVYAKIPANTENATPIGFIAHMDVVEEPKGYGVKPCLHKYNGGDIVLSNGDILSPKDFPVLNNYVGNTIITSDGTTILGSDDKAGVAEIMTLADFIVSNKDFKHGDILIGFTPDEEIGNGASKFDVKRFGAKYAYTIDGEEIGEISYETFNAASFEVNIKGINIHPGQAKDKMVNSIILGEEFIESLPKNERPETTEKREGFYFVHSIEGNIENTRITGIIRDHSKKTFEERKAFVAKVVEGLNKKYNGRFELKIKDQYYNCAEIIEQNFHLVEVAKSAMEELNVKPIVEPIRGGTDGSHLSFMGLPCPNLCTGGHNAHGRNEFVPLESMEKVVEVLKKICKFYAVNNL